MKTKSKARAGRSALPGAKNDTHTERARSTKRKKRIGPGRPRGSRNKRFGQPVEEAIENFNMKLLQKDVECAEAERTDDVNAEENFLSCVIAQCVTRIGGASQVAIERTVAYVAFPGEGVTRRYLIDKKSRETLEAWDRGEDVKEDVELRLLAPRKSHTLAALAKKNRVWHKKNPGAYKDKSARKTERKQRSRDPLHEVVRNGNLVRWS